MLALGSAAYEYGCTLFRWLLSKAYILFPIGAFIFWLTYNSPVWAVENLREHIEISLTMVVGSFVAGATALGGGAVAFPVLTKALHIEPYDAKLFSLAIQSFGMTAASLTILSQRLPFFVNAAKLSISAAIPGVIVSILWVSEYLSRSLIKFIFSLLLLSFAVVLVWLKSHRFSSDKTDIKASQIRDRRLIIVGSFVGGMISGIIGSGADILLFIVLVVLLRKDVKCATATSVIVMASVSLVSTLIHVWGMQVMTPEVASYVHAAIPIVVIGAPVGAYLCTKLPPTAVLALLLMLISCEVSFTFYQALAKFGPVS